MAEISKVLVREMVFMMTSFRDAGMKRTVAIYEGHCTPTNDMNSRSHEFRSCAVSSSGNKRLLESGVTTEIRIHHKEHKDRERSQRGEVENTRIHAHTHTSLSFVFSVH